MSIVGELHTARKEFHINQAHLAQQCGLDRMTIGRIENGADPQLSTIEKMAKALGLELVLIPRGMRSDVETFIQAGLRSS